MNCKIQTLIASVFLATSLSGCAWIHGLFDPSPPPPTPEDCTSACANLEKLDCPEGKSLEDGTTCVKFCEDTIEAGHALNTACITKVASCGEAHSSCGM